MWGGRRPPVKIDGVGLASQVDLKASLYRSQHEHSAGLSASRKRRRTNPIELSNRGVHDRSRRDLAEDEEANTLQCKAEEYARREKCPWSHRQQSDDLVDWEKKRSAEPGHVPRLPPDVAPLGAVDGRLSDEAVDAEPDYSARHRSALAARKQLLARKRAGRHRAQAAQPSKVQGPTNPPS